jgi:AbrB family looped-hinge helix DNA binding protein
MPDQGNTITSITAYWRWAMRVTIKGQVTIPQHIREKLGIVPATEIEFVEEKDRVYIVKKEGPGNRSNKFRKLRGVATVRMTTDEIMALTRKD